MLLIITIISIFGICFLVHLANRFLPFKICSICAGVSGTWIWLLIGYFLGYQIDLMVPAILMGGSVVGLAYQLEKKLAREKSSLLWKTLFISVGFIAVYELLIGGWLMFSVAMIFLLGVSFLFLSSRDKKDSDREKIEELKKKMDKCC